MPPAVVMVTTRQWCGRSVHGLRRRERPVLLRTWEGIEDIFARFCSAYSLACLSLRDAIFHDVVGNRPNFSIADVAADCLHPEQSRFGYHYMADMIIHFLRHSWQRYSARVSNSGPDVATRRPLPAALLQGNRGRAGRMVWRCYELPATPVHGRLHGERDALHPVDTGADMALRARRALRGHVEVRWRAESGDVQPLSDSSTCDALRRCVLRAARTGDGACLRGRGHWQHCSRALAPRAVNKPGIVSVLPGAAMRMLVDTTAPVAQAGRNASALPHAALALTYLASYERMGVAKVSCIKGCTCETRIIDALQLAQPASSTAAATRDNALSRNVSVASVVEIPVSGSRNCIVRVVNTPRRQGIGRDQTPAVAKWKLLGVRVGWESSV